MVTKPNLSRRSVISLFYSSERIDGNETVGEFKLLDLMFYSSERIDGNETAIRGMD